MSNFFSTFLTEKKKEIDFLIASYIKSVADNPCIPQELKDGIVYATAGEGKRLRAALVLLGWELCQDLFKDNPSKKHFFYFSSDLSRRCALGIELVHAYSLVHDDLPAMDNDSLRRGRPTCHIRFDEGTAILIGDALLNQAFEIILEDLNFVNHNFSIEEKLEVTSGLIRAARLLANAAGPEGMIGGQILDMASERKSVNIDELIQIHSGKTGKLIQAALNLVPTFYGEEGLVNFLGKYTEKIGLLYQVVDDILDTTSTPNEMGKSGTDLKNQKNTFIKLIGLKKSRGYAEKLLQQAKNEVKHLESVKFSKTKLSPHLLKYLYEFGELILMRSS